MTTEEFHAEYTEQEEKIFHAALKVFAANGKHGATVQLIADEASANKALVHYYFRSKDRLYDAVFSYVLRKYFMMLVETIEEQSDFKSMLRIFIDRYIDMVRENPEILQFILGELIRNPQEVHHSIGRNAPFMKTNPFQAFADVMQHAIEAGEIRPADPVHTFISTIGASLVVFVMHPIGMVFIPNLRENLPEVIEQRKQQIFELIYNGLRP